MPDWMVSSKVVVSVVGSVDSVVFGEVDADRVAIAKRSPRNPVSKTHFACTAITGRVLLANRLHRSFANAALTLLRLTHNDAIGSMSKLPSRSEVTR